MGSFTSAFFAGLGFGPLIGGFLKDTYSMDSAFLGMGVLSMAALTVTAFTLPRDRIPPLCSRSARNRDSAGKDGRPPGRNDDGAAPNPQATTITLLRDRQLQGLLLFRFTRALGIGLVWVIMPLYAVKTLEISALRVGVLLSTNTFVTTFLQSPMGHLSDRVGHRRSLTAGSLLAAGATAGIAWVREFGHLLTLSAALGIAGAVIVPAGSALAVSLGRRRGMGSVMGLYNSSLSLGTMLGPVLGGGLLDLAGVRTVFTAGGALGVIGWMALLTMYPSEAGDEK